MKKIALLLSLLFSVGVFSQTDFRKGFILNKSGQKIQGYVNYKENYSMHTLCEFKSTKTGSLTYYSPLQIKGYGFENDKVYISKSVNNKSFFLETIVSGKATLLKLNSIYYLEKGKEFKELNNEVVEYSTGSKIFRRSSKRYIGTLKVFFNDCIDVKNRINNTNYRERSLVNLVNHYNECMGGKSVVFKEDKPWFKANFGAFTGVSQSKLDYNYKSSEVVFFTNKSNSNITYTFGGYAELYSPRVSERLSFYTGFFILDNTYITNATSSNNGFNYINEVITNLKQLKIPIGVRYTFPEKVFTPFFTLGISNYSNINSSTNWIRESENNNVVNITSKRFDVGNLAVGFFGSIGVKKSISKKIHGFIDLIYENSTLKNYKNITDANSASSNGIREYQSTMTNLQLLIGIQF